jgi:hypothetical protein
LGSPAAERQVRLTLAHNFRLETNAARAAEEAPWQLKQAEAWNELEKLLTDLRWFQAIVARGSAELLDLWLPLKGRGRDPETLLIAAWGARKGERHGPEDLKLGAELTAFLRFAGAFGDGAVRLHEELVEASARRVGALAAETLERTKDLASLLLARGEYRSAAERLSQVYAIERRTLGGGDTTTALTAGLLARVALAERDYATAEPLLKDAYDVLRSAHGETDADTLSAMVDFAKIEAERGNLKEAGRLRRTVMKKRIAALGPEHPSTLEARAIYLDTQIDRGDLIDAKYEARAILEARERVLGLDHPLTLFSAVALALTLVRLDDHDARKLLDYSRQKLEHVLGHEHPEALSALQSLAERMIIASQFEEGEALLRRLIAARRRVLGPVHLDTLESMTALMSIFREQGRLAEAESEQRQIAEGAEKALGRGSPRARWERDRLDRIRQMRRDERK